MEEGYNLKTAKKSDLANCINWWGISQTGNIFSQIILKRLTIVLDDINQEQAGFRKKSYAMIKS